MKKDAKSNLIPRRNHDCFIASGEGKTSAIGKTSRKTIIFNSHANIFKFQFKYLHWLEQTDEHFQLFRETRHPMQATA